MVKTCHSIAAGVLLATTLNANVFAGTAAMTAAEASALGSSMSGAMSAYPDSRAKQDGRATGKAQASNTGVDTAYNREAAAGATGTREGAVASTQTSASASITGNGTLTCLPQAAGTFGGYALKVSSCNTAGMAFWWCNKPRIGAACKQTDWVGASIPAKGSTTVDGKLTLRAGTMNPGSSVSISYAYAASTSTNVADGKAAFDGNKASGGSVATVNTTASTQEYHDTYAQYLATREQQINDPNYPARVQALQAKLLQECYASNTTTNPDTGQQEPTPENRQRCDEQNAQQSQALLNANTAQGGTPALPPVQSNAASTN